MDEEHSEQRGIGPAELLTLILYEHLAVSVTNYQGICNDYIANKITVFVNRFLGSQLNIVPL